jgi:hypothetical protein
MRDSTLSIRNSTGLGFGERRAILLQALDCRCCVSRRRGDVSVSLVNKVSPMFMQVFLRRVRVLGHDSRSDIVRQQAHGVQDESANDQSDPLEEDDVDDEGNQEPSRGQVHGPQFEVVRTVDGNPRKEQSGQTEPEGNPKGLPEDGPPDGSDQDTDQNQGDVHSVDEVGSNAAVADAKEGVRLALRGTALTPNVVIISFHVVLSTHR